MIKNTIMLRNAACALAIAGVYTLGHSGSAAAQESQTGDVILNEWNAVKDDRPVDGWDPTFGGLDGNGGNWIELYVNADTVDMRGWKIEWRNDQSESGSITFSNDSRWNGLRKGTLITLREADGEEPENPPTTNIDSYDPCGGQFWINVDLEDSDGLTTVGGADGWKVDNDGWHMQILDDDNDVGLCGSTNGGRCVVQMWTGEPLNPATYDTLWNGSNLGNEEVGKLEACPSVAAANPSPEPNYQDGESSTFGLPNVWHAPPTPDGDQVSCIEDTREEVMLECL